MYEKGMVYVWGECDVMHACKLLVKGEGNLKEVGFRFGAV